jgi:SAM-dependent methyltransferase
MSIQQRAAELAEFFRMPEPVALAKLSLGFMPLHEAVTADFKARVGKIPFLAEPSEAALLKWYRETEAYIWELSAYHEDEGFNYAGMCSGIAQCLTSNGCSRVLCLGDGIGDLTLTLRRAGMKATYHDLMNSRTAEFALSRLGPDDTFLTNEFDHGFPGWLDGTYDGIVSLDYFEHLPNLPEWMRACRAALKPGGLMMAKNAFGKGSGPQGAMPMHLTVNDKYADEAEWRKLCGDSGFALYSDRTPDWWVRR